MPNWKKIKLKIFVFIPLFHNIILIMDQDIKNNKKVLWYINTVSLKLQGAYNKAYFCSFTVRENIMHIVKCKVDVMYFIFIFISLSIQRSSVESP